MSGVVTTPPALDLRRAIAGEVVRELAKIPPDKSGAIVGVLTATGANLVIAGKVGPYWEVQGWVGKTWTTPVAGGVDVKATW